MTDPTVTPEMLDRPKLLRVPLEFHSVDQVLETAKQMNLPNVLLLSEAEDGTLIYLDSGMTISYTNWLLDKMKSHIFAPVREA